MPISTPMEPVTKVGRYRLFRAEGRHHLHPGLHLWTGRRHRQIWPVFQWKFWRSIDG